jgi:hypothetical protein
MTKNGLDIQTISTKRTDKQADRVLLFGQLTEKKEIAYPSHFLKFLLSSPQVAHLVLPHPQADPSAKPKEPNFRYAPDTMNNNFTKFANI